MLVWRRGRCEKRIGRKSRGFGDAKVLQDRPLGSSVPTFVPITPVHLDVCVLTDGEPLCDVDQVRFTLYERDR